MSITHEMRFRKAVVIGLLGVYTISLVMMLFTGIIIEPTLGNTGKLNNEVPPEPPYLGIANCSQPDDSPVTFTRLDNSTFIMTGFYDTRLNNANYVRVIILISRSQVPLPNINCTISVIHELTPTVISELTSAGSLYVFNENHGKRLSGYILSCPYAKSYVLTDCSVRLTLFLAWEITVDIPVVTIHPAVHKPIYEFSVCIPPIWGNIDEYKLIEFIEMSHLLGADHFYFYVVMNRKVFPNYENINRVLKHYVQSGVVTVREWLFPQENYKDIWYRGQVLAIHDCLYKTSGLSKYVALCDIDEIIVPKQYDTWNMLLLKLDKRSNTSHCGYRIKMAFFEPSPIHPILLNSVKRSVNVTDVRTKCIVRPDRIFEQGIHHISKQLREDWTPDTVPEDMALVHHYRKCDTLYHMQCYPQVTDDSLLRYQTQFGLSYYDVISKVKHQRFDSQSREGKVARVL